MFEIISIILFLALIGESYAFWRVVSSANEKIEAEQAMQEQTQQRIEDLYKTLVSIGESSVYVQDPLVSEIYNKCKGLLDYFDFVYYKEDKEKWDKIHALQSELEELIGKKVDLSSQPGIRAEKINGSKE